MQNDQGDAYYLRYYDNGSVYYLNQYGDYEQVEGNHLPHLLYVDDDGVAYFSKMQQQHNVYFSLDSYGDFDWVDYHDVPNYEMPPDDDGYEYPRVVEYEYGDEGWALVEMEDGRLVKYYDEGGAYWVDEYGNEEAFTVSRCQHCSTSITMVTPISASSQRPRAAIVTTRSTSMAVSSTSMTMTCRAMKSHRMTT